MKRSLAMLLCVGACVSAPKRPVVLAPSPRPAPALSPPPVVAWEDSARTVGNWVLSRDAFSTLASFGATGFAISCDNDNAVRFRIEGSSPNAIIVRTSTLSRTLATTDFGHLPTGVAARLAPGDTLLDAIIFSRGKFMVAFSQTELILPPWPEIARVVEDCRR